MNATEVAKLLESVTPAQVMSAYEGRAGKCYCGCAGNHRYASKHREVAGVNRGYAISDDEVNDRQVKKVLRIVKENFSYDHETCREGDQPFHIQEASDPARPGKGFVTHFTAEVGARSYTIYLTPKG